MEIQQAPVLAGAISTLWFASSNLPMLYKAFRTQDLHSYSPIQLAMANVGNAIHWLYIAALPFGPIWFLHGFNTVATALMLGG